MIKKYIDAIFSANPIYFLFFTTIVICLLAIENESEIFFYPAIFFLICLAVALFVQIKSFLKRFRSLVGWLICFGLTVIFFFSKELLKKLFIGEGVVADVSFIIWLEIFFSLLLYLIFVPAKVVYKFLKTGRWRLGKIKVLVKPTLIILGCVYVVASLFVIVDYVRTQYGYVGKFLCSYGTPTELKKSVVRIVGGYSEGTGFFISENQILTNFHVIAGEPSPKIIFPDGNFITPTKITGDSQADLAILFTEHSYPDLVMPLPDEITIKDEEPLLATGYAMGTDLVGKATVLKGNFVDFRKSKYESVEYIQTSISLVEGMSGGPLTDQCGDVVGVNTQGLAGLSLFVSADEAKKIIPDFSDQEIEKIEVDASKSPEDAVFAFYTYLKARRMKDGFNLLSSEYLQKTNFEEWTNRFNDVLDVNIFKSERLGNSKDTAKVKFGTKNWVNQEIEVHLYEGAWQTVFEDGVYKMLKSNIKEIENPDYFWFYE